MTLLCQCGALAVPIMISIGIQTLYTLIDMIYIGRLGGDAIAAVAFNMPIFFFIMGLSFGLGNGVTASIARFIGSNDKIMLTTLAEHAVAMGALISLILTVSGLLFGKKFYYLLVVLMTFFHSCMGLFKSKLLWFILWHILRVL